LADLDHELDAIVAGDAQAFGRWVAGAEVELRGSLRPFAKWVDTEMVLQEALLRVWQVAPRFVRDGRPNGLLRLAVTTARNLARSEARRFRPESTELDALERSLSSDAHADPAMPDRCCAGSSCSAARSWEASPQRRCAFASTMPVRSTTRCSRPAWG